MHRLIARGALVLGSFAAFAGCSDDRRHGFSFFEHEPSETILATSQSRIVLDARRKPIAELARMGWIAGTWTAHEAFEDRAKTGHDTTYVFAPTMAGRWIFGADGDAADYVYITYDPLAKHWIMTRFGAGPSYGTYVSLAGWTGRQIAFDSISTFADGREYHRRTTFERRDRNHFALWDEERLASGKYMLDDRIDFTKG